MMPLAPHISLPAIGHMTASNTSESLSSSMSSKPKLAFSIDAIVGRKSSSITDSHKDFGRLSPCYPTQHKSRYSPVNCVRSISPPISHRLSERSSHLSQQLSPSHQNGTNVSPLSIPSPISMSNGSTASMSYLEGRINPLLAQQAHAAQHSMAQNGQIPHPLMMANHMSPMTQSYHQSVALYPWLLRANPYANRFNGMPFDGGLSSYPLPPFRKPKRIRTAFSPGQLLKLEEVFEKNQYVVGSERKQLASGLGLSETQIKVWFQNRRTKHKRQKLEEYETTGAPNDKLKNIDITGAESDIDSEEEDDDERKRSPDRSISYMSGNEAFDGRH